MVTKSTNYLEDISRTNWSDYKSVRLRALNEVPQAFGAKFSIESEFPDEKWLERAKQVEDGLHHGVVAKINDIPVGVMGAYIVSLEGKLVANIHSVFVVPEVRGRGIATKMMSLILKKIMSNPEVKKIELTVSTDQTNAIQLYKKFGFKKIGEAKGVLGDGVEHAENIMGLDV